jgi:ADP-ribosyl-[dinitrogen reductase] hydrolase
VTLKGSCLCGAVRYEVDQLDSPIGHCHCQTCRKAHASAFATTARVLREHFRWTAGEDRLNAFESSPGKLRRFCSVCGTQMMAEWVAQPQIVLRVPTLDDDPGTRPVVHIWTSHDQPWLVEAGEAARYAEWPPGR